MSHQNRSSISVQECVELLHKQSEMFHQQLQLIRRDVISAMENEFTELLGQIADAHIRYVWDENPHNILLGEVTAQRPITPPPLICLPIDLVI